MEEDELQDQLDDNDGQEDTDSGSDNSAPPENESAAEKESKRVNDLMSKWQAEQARAAKLEKQLQAMQGGQGDDTQGDNDGGSRLNEFEEFARENARITLFNSNPLLKDAGFEPEDIAGSTLAEMRASVTKHLKRAAGMESRLRNKVLAETGLDPEVSTGAGTEKTPSFSTMSDKEFADFLAQRDSRAY